MSPLCRLCETISHFLGCRCRICVWLNIISYWFLLFYSYIVLYCLSVFLYVSACLSFYVCMCLSMSVFLYLLYVSVSLCLCLCLSVCVPFSVFLGVCLSYCHCVNTVYIYCIYIYIYIFPIIMQNSPLEEILLI